LPGEGGNGDMAPVSEEDEAVWRFARQQLSDISDGKVGWERILSGSGLELLYQAHCDKREPAMAAPDITAQALDNPQSLSGQVVEHFCKLLGQCAGNAALVTGARSGVYIAGGIIPRIIDLFMNSGFRSAFEARDKMAHYMADIPTWLMLAGHPGLTGAAAWLKMHRQQREG
ncbi:glucokinase, partial [Sansalvadorimonas verongulae]|uniref:glucokinase n=1 Tax=Sansalvadorimonas verongulae TaxID=2172824 RepID=UPI0018AD154B